MEPVLAKSKREDRPEITLDAHASDVAAAARCMFGSAEPGGLTRLGHAWLRFFRLDKESMARRLCRALAAAAWLHDLGKANKDFQKVVRDPRGRESLLRHEHVSALWMLRPPLHEWLRKTLGPDFLPVLAAVAGHHLKAGNNDFAKPSKEGNLSLEILPEAEEVRNILGKLQNDLKSGPIGSDKTISLWSRRERDGLREQFEQYDQEVRKNCRKDESCKRFIAALRSALIAADAAASAVRRKGLPLNEWIDSCFGGSPLTPDWMDRNVIEPRIKEIENRSHLPFKWHDFQTHAARSGPRVLLLSSCGSGKTLAGWRWMREQLASHSARRAIFLYPTRATATEGFRDYASWAGEDAALQHGTSEYDLEGMFSSPDDPRHGRDYGVMAGLFALGYWPKRVFSATVDSFLAFMRNQYASVCMLPVLCDSLLVVDEVHSFTDPMLTSLERFLKAFDLPVMAMTATLSEDRRRVLTQGCGLAMFPGDDSSFADLRRQSERPRYRLERIDNEEEAAQRVRKALSSDRRVLWVANTVDRCQKNARMLGDCGAEVLVYHSRFCLMHRKERHELAIRDFREKARIVLVTTQVCEMSLDLDADVLVTEIAPPSSLVQRMGRCCRNFRDDNRMGQVLIYPAPDRLPYDEPGEYEAGEHFLKILLQEPQPLSQARLSELMASITPHSPFQEEASVSFIDAGMFACARDDTFRDNDEYAVDAVLDKDLEDFLKLRRNRDPRAAGFVLPVPRRFARQDARVAPLWVAPSQNYSQALGFHKGDVSA